MIRCSLRKVTACVKNYFKENWGAPFILGFIGTLFVISVFLSLGLVALANTASVFAIVSLMVGIALQIIGFVNSSAIKGEVSNETN